MSIEENKAFVRRFIEEFYNQRNAAVADELIVPNLLRGSLQNGLNQIRLTFTDYRLTVEDTIGEADRVAVRWTANATRTGKPFQATGIFIFRIGR